MHDRDENLARFRYHTGATLRRLSPDEPCPRLYRDIGPEAMARFLAGQLERLAGPMAPILYSRTASYQEPYRDYEPVGRLVFLKPRELRPWFSGVTNVYVAAVPCDARSVTVGFLPAQVDPSRAETLLEGVASLAELRDALGSRLYDEAVKETRVGLERLNRELAETEALAEPIRRRLQSRERDEAEAARDWLGRHGLNESDLCTRVASSAPRTARPAARLPWDCPVSRSEGDDHADARAACGGRGRPRLGPMPLPHVQRAPGAAGLQPRMPVLFLALVDQLDAP